MGQIGEFGILKNNDSSSLPRRASFKHVGGENHRTKRREERSGFPAPQLKRVVAFFFKRQLPHQDAIRLNLNNDLTFFDFFVDIPRHRFS